MMLSSNSVCSTTALRSTGPRIAAMGTTEIEQAVDDALAPMHLVIHDAEVLGEVAAERLRERRVDRQSAMLSAHAAMVASGLLISCMTPGSS